jgi:hypothetical protein
MAIRFFVGCKGAPTEGAVQSKKLKFRNGVGIENLIRPVGFFSVAVPSFTSARRWRRLG